MGVTGDAGDASATRAEQLVARHPRGRRRSASASGSASRTAGAGRRGRRATPTASSSARRSCARCSTPPTPAAGLAALAASTADLAAGVRGARGERPRVTALLPLGDPEPVAGRLAPRARSRCAPTRSRSSPASSSALWLTARRWVERGGDPDDGAGHRLLGRAVRHRRRPDLPRDHLAATRTSARAATRCSALRDLGGRPRHLGRGRPRRGRRLDRLPPRRASGSPPFADALAPGLLVAQAIGRLGQLVQPGAVRRPDRRCRGACEIDAAHLPGGLRRRARCSTRRSSTSCSGTSPAPRCSSGSTAGSGSGHGRVFWLYVVRLHRRAGSGSSCCASTRPRRVLGLRLNVWTSIIVGLGALVAFVRGRAPAPRTRARPSCWHPRPRRTTRQIATEPAR